MIVAPGPLPLEQVTTGLLLGVWGAVLLWALTPRSALPHLVFFTVNQLCRLRPVRALWSLVAHGWARVLLWAVRELAPGAGAGAAAPESERASQPDHRPAVIPVAIPRPRSEPPLPSSSSSTQIDTASSEAAA